MGNRPIYYHFMAISRMPVANSGTRVRVKLCVTAQTC